MIQGERLLEKGSFSFFVVVSRRIFSRIDVFPAACASGIQSQLTTYRTMALNVKPLGDRILVEAVEEKEVKKGGIIIPDSAKEKPMESIVVALGTGKTDDNGKKVPFEVKKGDRILCSKYGGTEIKLDGREYKILNSDDVLAILD
jgi:chaperonin GroES